MIKLAQNVAEFVFADDEVKKVPCESLSEDEEFEQRELASLLVSKVEQRLAGVDRSSAGATKGAGGRLDRERIRASILDEAAIVFSTLSFSGSAQFASMNRIFDVVIIDEAAQAVLSEIIEACREHDFTDVILVNEHRGVPNHLVVCHLPFGPTAYFGLFTVVTRHGIKDKKSLGTMPEAYPHLILNNLTTKVTDASSAPDHTNSLNPDTNEDTEDGED